MVFVPSEMIEGAAAKPKMSLEQEMPQTKLQVVNQKREQES